MIYPVKNINATIIQNVVCPKGFNGASSISVNNGKNSWSECVSLYTEGFAVTANTQAVVLCSPIQYAVGSLEIKAKFNGELEDNGDNWPTLGTGTGTVVTTPTDGFPLTGVMIGGQKNATWNK